MLEIASNARFDASNTLRTSCANALKKVISNGSKVAHDISRHEYLIQRILEAFPDAETKGFAAAIDRYQRDDPDEDEDTLDFNYRPDAFLIDEIERVVLVFEVECHHHLSQAKMDAYEWLAWELEGSFVLIRVDDRGDVRVVNFVDEYLHEISPSPGG